MKKAAERELAEFYPRDTDGARPIAYLWARTVRCEAPNCGAQIPLLRSFWLCKKAQRRRALRTKVVRPAKGEPRVEFELFTPTTEKEVRGGTVSRAKATCVCCNIVLHPDRVRAQLTAQRGGADVVFDEKGGRTGGATLLAVVTFREGQSGRHYRLPTDVDYAAVWKAQQRLKEVTATKLTDGLTQSRTNRRLLEVGPAGRKGVQRAEVRHDAMGRPVHGSPETRSLCDGFDPRFDSARIRFKNS